MLTASCRAPERRWAPSLITVNYVDEEAAAQDAQAGLWRGEFVPPWEWGGGASDWGYRARTLPMWNSQYWRPAARFVVIVYLSFTPLH